jgi:hypothetical protein
MKKKVFYLSFLFSLTFNFAVSQSYYFGIKGGPSLGYQKWENFNQGLLMTYHATAFWESYSENNPNNSLYAQLGFHNRGSALRNLRVLTNDNSIYTLPTQKFVFSNLSLGVGAKKKHEINDKLSSFYSLGIRAEYNLFTNLHTFEEYNTTYFTNYYPVNAFKINFTYGATVGGGLEFYFSELTSGIIELSVNPDFSNQYVQPSYQTPDPMEPHNNRIIPRRSIKNTTVEISFGLRFLRKVIYID